MDDAFAVHKLNEQGMAKAQTIALEFDNLWTLLKSLGGGCCNYNMNITKMRLQEACFFAKKGMASQKENQQQ